MSERSPLLTNRAARMRHAFDQAFAVAPPSAPPPQDAVLAIQVNGQGYAMRLSAVAGLFADRAITPLGAAPAGLLGLAGFRGSVVAVWDLRRLLGHSESKAPPRWLAVVAGVPLALAFDEYEGLLRVPREEGAFRDGRPLVDVALLVDEIRSRKAGSA